MKEVGQEILELTRGLNEKKRKYEEPGSQQLEYYIQSQSPKFELSHLEREQVQKGYPMKELENLFYKRRLEKLVFFSIVR